MGTKVDNQGLYPLEFMTQGKNVNFDRYILDNVITNLCMNNVMLSAS